jgi:hypothetical protein
MRPRTVLAAALLLAGLACGNSREEKVVDQAEADCLALTQPGTTLNDASIAMRGAQVFLSPSCDPKLVPLQSNDRCAPAESDARCETFWYFYTTSICSSAGGCCAICEVRLLQSDLSKNGASAAVCGSAFHRKQPCL